MPDLIVERVVPASAAHVWRAWMEADRLASWFWPPRFEATAEIDPRAGGRFRVASAPAGIGVSGRFGEVRPPQGFTTTWRWDGEEAETQVAVSLTEQPDGTTLLRVHHDGFENEQDVAHHVEGWNDCLDRLPAALG